MRFWDEPELTPPPGVFPVLNGTARHAPAMLVVSQRVEFSAVNVSTTQKVTRVRAQIVPLSHTPGREVRETHGMRTSEGLALKEVAHSSCGRHQVGGPVTLTTSPPSGSLARVAPLLLA